MNWWTILLTGLTSGGLSCVALQGGLLTGLFVSQKASKRQSGQGLLAFFVGKLLSHTLFGVGLGWVGQQVSVSLGLQLSLQILAGLWLLVTAANLLELHPAFRHLTLRPPKLVNKSFPVLKQQPVLMASFGLGLLSVLIPCGVTQSMELLALQLAHPLSSGWLMALFVLGTIPVFSMLTLGATWLSSSFKKVLVPVTAVTLLFIGLYQLNGVLVVRDAPITFQKVVSAILDPAGMYSSNKSNLAPIEDGYQVVEIQVTNRGYVSEASRVKLGTPVKLRLISNETYSCAIAFVFPAFSVRVNLDPTDVQEFVITPNKAGVYRYSCSMGMYTGTLEVI